MTISIRLNKISHKSEFSPIVRSRLIKESQKKLLRQRIKPFKRPQWLTSNLLSAAGKFNLEPRIIATKGAVKRVITKDYWS